MASNDISFGNQGLKKGEGTRNVKDNKSDENTRLSSDCHEISMNGNNCNSQAQLELNVSMNTLGYSRVSHASLTLVGHAEETGSNGVSVDSQKLKQEEHFSNGCENTWNVKEEKSDENIELNGDCPEVTVNVNNCNSQEQLHLNVSTDTLGSSEIKDASLTADAQAEIYVGNKSFKTESSQNHSEACLVDSTVKNSVDRCSKSTDESHLDERLIRIINESISEGNVEKIVQIIKEQKSHDLLCPVCGSCITKRVILRKRKRKGVGSGSKTIQVDDFESFLSPAHDKRTTVSESYRTSQNLLVDDKEQQSILEASEEIVEERTTSQPLLPIREDDEVYGCLSCFSVFFRKGKCTGPERSVDDEDKSGCFYCIPFHFDWWNTEPNNGEGLEEPLVQKQESSVQKSHISKVANYSSKHLQPASIQPADQEFKDPLSEKEALKVNSIPGSAIASASFKHVKSEKMNVTEQGFKEPFAEKEALEVNSSPGSAISGTSFKHMKLDKMNIPAAGSKLDLTEQKQDGGEDCAVDQITVLHLETTTSLNLDTEISSTETTYNINKKDAGECGKLGNVELLDNVSQTLTIVTESAEQKLILARTKESERYISGSSVTGNSNLRKMQKIQYKEISKSSEAILSSSVLDVKEARMLGGKQISGSWNTSVEESNKANVTVQKENMSEQNRMSNPAGCDVIERKESMTRQSLCSCLPFPLRMGWPTWPEKVDQESRLPLLQHEVNIQEPLNLQKPRISFKNLSSESVQRHHTFADDKEVKPMLQPDSIVAETSDHRTVIDVINTRPTDTTNVLANAPESPHEGVPQANIGTEWDILKSVVYGGLPVSITSLGIISSAAGAEAKTLDVIVICLGHLISGLLMIVNNMSLLDESQFIESVGHRHRFNGSVALLSYIIFGTCAPIAYGLSFRKSDDILKKFIVTSGVSLIAIIFLSLSKARVSGRSYIRTLVLYLVTGFWASIAGFLAGEYVKKLLQKWGIKLD